MVALLLASLLEVLLVLLLSVLVLARVLSLDGCRGGLPAREALPRCDGGIEMGGASLCVLRDRP
jgi:hypothetical protein